jgi:hypothetical protein
MVRNAGSTTIGCLFETCCRAWRMRSPSPKDALSRPTMTQRLTRCLLARGWSAALIAGLVGSKYARDYGWEDRWTPSEARRRASWTLEGAPAALRARRRMHELAGGAPAGEEGPATGVQDR